jgi:hypothetical protein
VRGLIEIVARHSLSPTTSSLTASAPGSDPVPVSARVPRSDPIPLAGPDPGGYDTVLPVTNLRIAA